MILLLADDDFDDDGDGDAADDSDDDEVKDDKGGTVDKGENLHTSLMKHRLQRSCPNCLEILEPPLFFSRISELRFVIYFVLFEIW